jgi:exodeoxyribonuclease VII small subunit
MCAEEDTLQRELQTKRKTFMAKEEKARTFEESVAQLEQIVAAIESGEIGLEESLAKYEQGMELVKKCRGILDRAEKRIEQLTQKGETLCAEPMDPKQVMGEK